MPGLCNLIYVEKFARVILLNMISGDEFMRVILLFVSFCLHRVQLIVATETITDVPVSLQVLC